MKYNSDFNLDEVLRTLGAIAGKYQDASPEDQALRIAAVALYFIRDSNKLEQYRGFFRDFYTPAREAITVSHSFSTPEEANAWLKQGTPGEIVKIGGLAHVVANGPKGLMLVRTYLPQELEEMD